MSTTHVNTPTSTLRLGHACADTTPPVGIYHRMWGAARHDKATGIHRPLQADVIIFEPIDANKNERVVRVQLELVNLTNEQMDRISANVGEATGVSPERVLFTFSHSHASGNYGPGRKGLPGGDLIEPYLDDLNRKLVEIASEAVASIENTTITYGLGHCDMSANRDYRDEEAGIYATGYNPDRDHDDTVLVARVTDEGGDLKLIIVSYACHPTTLAWDNTLISPDYVGTLRDTVAKNAGVPCCFLQAPSGDLGPRDGFVGDTEVADRNGRQVGYAALSILHGMGAPAHDFTYAGPVVSGATIGTWEWREQQASRAEETSRFDGGLYEVALQLIDLPSQDQLQSELRRYTEEQADADDRGDTIVARDLGARAERCRRWLGRLELLPDGKAFPYRFAVFRFGDAVWVTCGGEPYSWLQTELRRRFPGITIMINSLSGDTQVAYLLREEDYGKGLYQEEPSSLAKGCLERLADAISDRIAEVTGVTPETLPDAHAGEIDRI